MTGVQTCALPICHRAVWGGLDTRWRRQGRTGGEVQAADGGRRVHLAVFLELCRSRSAPAGRRRRLPGRRSLSRITSDCGGRSSRPSGNGRKSACNGRGCKQPGNWRDADSNRDTLLVANFGGRCRKGCDEQRGRRLHRARGIPITSGSPAAACSKPPATTGSIGRAPCSERATQE